MQSHGPYTQALKLEVFHTNFYFVSLTITMDETFELLSFTVGLPDHQDTIR